MGGSVGGAHSKEFMIADKELAYINAAKALICTAIDMLADGAELGLDIKNNFKAPMTKEEYLTKWGHME